jgi:hypothetical protein
MRLERFGLVSYPGLLGGFMRKGGFLQVLLVEDAERCSADMIRKIN